MKPAQQVLTLLALLPLCGCSMLGFSRPVEVHHQRIQTASGVAYEDILLGNGAQPTPGDRVLIDYVGYLSDGTQFDSSVDRGVPLEIVFGEAPLAGWNAGMEGMKVGGKRRMQLPSELAYGSAGIPGLVPADETLTYELELLEIL